jgi:phosphoribosylformylglycinamidine cyclo-ligase
LDKIIVGQDIRPGDVVIGLPSSGIHSNGLTLARDVFFHRAKLRPEQHMPEFGRSLGEELLEPTRIYVREVLDVLRSGVQVKAMAHITSDGLTNLLRVQSAVGYVLDALPEPPPVFRLLQRLGGVSDAEMFQVYNMGVGFCLVVAAADADKALETLRRQKAAPLVLGCAVADPDRTVRLPNGLVGQGNDFRRSG